MQHKGTEILKTKRLLLRRFTERDANAMYQTWARDERVTRYLTWTPHASVEVTRSVILDWVTAYEKRDFYQWVIVLDGAPIGAVSVVRLQERSEWAELGYCMGFDYWNRGLMTEAVQAVIEFLFDSVGVNRICIEHAVQNPASGKVAKKCGMTYEGTKRSFFKTANGEFLDISFWGLLRSEWNARKQR